MVEETDLLFEGREDELIKECLEYYIRTYETGSPLRPGAGGPATTQRKELDDEENSNS